MNWFVGTFQIALTLAVGERAVQFEHRDLHWGNVLISNTNEKNIKFILDGDTLTTSSKGIEVNCLSGNFCLLSSDCFLCEFASGLHH